LPLLGPAERRAQRAANRAAGQADRAARREARREVLAEQRAERAAEASARAAERDSVVYERVPVSEWQTVLRDPQVRLASQATLDVPGRVLKISRAELAATGVRSLSQGEVTGLLKTNEVSLDGKVSTTLAELEQVLARRTPVPLELEGQQEFAFQVRGPLASPEVQVTGGWERAAAAGLVAGPARFTAQLKDQVFELQPTSFSLSGGEMHVGARANLAAQPLVVEIPAGPVCTNVALTQQICNGWMQYIAPMVSQAARAEGIFSLSLDETRLTPQDLAHAQLSGRLEIPAGRLLPGPLFEQLGQLIAPIEAAARRGGLMADLLSTEKPLAVMQNQVIDFELHDGRIHHTPALVELRKVAISTSGSVGLDQTLDITAVLLFPTNWVERLPFLAGPGGQGQPSAFSGNWEPVRWATCWMVSSRGTCRSHSCRSPDGGCPGSDWLSSLPPKALVQPREAADEATHQKLFAVHSANESKTLLCVSIHRGTSCVARPVGCGRCWA
jgi:hypothetical protein